jgi:hypothetical protein
MQQQSRTRHQNVARTSGVGRWFASLGFTQLCYLFSAIVVLMILSSLGFYFFNNWLDPLADSFKEQNEILASNTVNWEKKCIDDKVRASWNGYDNCNEHRKVLDSYYYYEVLKIYGKKMAPCGKDGCFSISMNPISWLTFVLPMSVGIGGVLFVVLLGAVIILLNNMLMRRYEMPTTVQFSKAPYDYQSQYCEPERQSIDT